MSEKIFVRAAERRRQRGAQTYAGDSAIASSIDF
jgi:hypothetical protein